jgi:YggT family protein
VGLGRPLMVLTALTRYDVANYVQALFGVYILILLVYILTNLLFSFGARPSYSRWLDAVLGFMRDVSEPYLRLFRKFIPPIGMVDLSPMVAIFVLGIADRVIVNAING